MTSSVPGHLCWREGMSDDAGHGDEPAEVTPGAAEGAHMVPTCYHLLCDVRPVPAPLWVPGSKLSETRGFPQGLWGPRHSVRDMCPPCVPHDRHSSPSARLQSAPSAPHRSV